MNFRIAALAGLLLLVMGGARANDLANSTWSESDAANNSSSPNGWTSGSMTPSQVEPTARAMMGAIKRFYNHINATLTSGGSANAQVLTYAVAPASPYAGGDAYTFKAGFSNTGATTLNINGLGAVAIKIGTAALKGGEIVAGRVIQVYYDGSVFQLANANVINGGLTTTFWGGPFVDQVRLANRVFMGAAVQDNGVDTFPQVDWCAQLLLQSYNGGAGVQCSGDYSQTYILGNITAAAGTPANIATPFSALTVGNSSLHSVSTAATTYSTPRVLDLVSINNPNTAPSGGGPLIPLWTIYLEGHQVSANAGQTYGIEAELRNSVAQNTGWTPEVTDATKGSTVGLELGCGAGLSATGQFPCTVGMYFAATSTVPSATPWGAGIIFFPNSIGAFGPSSTYSAIEMPNLYEIQWYHTGLQGRVFLDNSDDMNVLSGGGILNITGGISSAASTNLSLAAPAGQVVSLAVTGSGTGVNFNGSEFTPSSSNTYGLGSASNRWLFAYTKNLVITQASPAAADACVAGQLVADTGFLYTCAATGTWKRVAVTGGY